jgi:catechol 2,3-dioxygenase-like lactoylglutathione lyase family enzyme
MAKINGIAHVALTVSNISISKPFYRRLFKTLEMKIVLDQEDSLYGLEVELES